MSLWERHCSERAKTGFGVSNENLRRKMNTQISRQGFGVCSSKLVAYQFPFGWEAVRGILTGVASVEMREAEGGHQTVSMHAAVSLVMKGTWR